MNDKSNTGRIGERLVANELESHGYRVTSLNKEGNATNADLLAAKSGKHWLIQVKTSKYQRDWQVTYGYTSQEHIDGTSRHIYNEHPDGDYHADIVVLVAMKTLREYRCIVMPVDTAEKAFQLQLEEYWTKPTKRDGHAKKPARCWASLDRAIKGSPLREQERKILIEHEDAWNVLS
jgi:Holliday junction resolvase-like predicted endonuclease